MWIYILALYMHSVCMNGAGNVDDVCCARMRLGHVLHSWIFVSGSVRLPFVVLTTHYIVVYGQMITNTLCAVRSFLNIIVDTYTQG